MAIFVDLDQTLVLQAPLKEHPASFDLTRALTPMQVLNMSNDDLVKRLFRNRLHLADENRIVFARKGKSARSQALGQAITRAKANFERAHGKPSNRPTRIISAFPREFVGLQVIDYYLWALQRMYEKDEDRFFNLVEVQTVPETCSFGQPGDPARDTFCTPDYVLSYGSIFEDGFYNDTSANFSEVTPLVSLTRNFENGMVYFLYSEGFLSGSFNDELNTTLVPELAPLLTYQPEHLNNFEVGYKGGTDSLFYELSLFQIDLENELIPYELAEFPGRDFFSNAGSSERTGVEAALSWQHDSGFGIDASYTWSDFTFKSFMDDNGNDFSGNQLPGLPKQFGYLGLNYATDNGFSGVLETRYSGDLYANNANSAKVPSYFVTNLRFNIDYQRGKWLYRPYAGINNLFDESYNNNIRINAFGSRFFEPAPGRHVYVGIVVNYAMGNTR